MPKLPKLSKLTKKQKIVSAIVTLALTVGTIFFPPAAALNPFLESLVLLF